MDLFKFIPSRFFARQARQPKGLFARYIMSALFKKGNNAINQLVNQSLALATTDRVLEIGYGPGLLIRQITEQTPENKTSGIDFSQAMYQQACEYNQDYVEQGLLELLLANCSSLPYADNCFDKICCVNVIYFWQQPERNLTEIYRVLKPGGILVIGFRNKKQMQQLNLDKHIFTSYSEHDIKKLLTENQFQNIHIKHQQQKPLDSYCAIAYKLNTP